VTYPHPFWSLDRGDWVPAGELRPGERLATRTGTATVERLAPDAAWQRVYNLEVEGEHRYLVTGLEVLAHNAYPDPRAGIPNGMPQYAREGLEDLRKFRAELGPIPGGGQPNGGVLAKLEVGGRSFYGVNAHGQHITLKVNAVSLDHAELDAFQQAANANVYGGAGRLFVDAELCGYCTSAIRSLGRQLGLSFLEVITPKGIARLQLE
jgi:hypothetical protein